MTDSPGDGNGNALESQLKGENLELTLATLRAERDRLVAQYERRIAEVSQAIERVEAAAAARDQPAPKQQKPGRKEEPAEGKSAPKRQTRARAPRRTPPRKPGGSR